MSDTDSKSYELRIVESKWVPITEIKKHPNNWRVHPKYQMEIMDGVLDQLGWTERLMVNVNTGRLINGHMRYELAIKKGETEVPVDFVDLSEEEEAMALATHDPIASMAVTDRQKHEQLLDNIVDESEKLDRLLSMYDEQEKSVGSQLELVTDMELTAFEGYDYIVLLFKNQLDWITALDKLGVQKGRISINAKGQEKTGLGRVIDGSKFLERLS